MKRILYSITFCLLAFASPAQRILPVLEASDTAPFDPLNGDVYAFCKWDGDLVVGGRFETFNGTSFNNLLVWDGTYAYPIAFPAGMESLSITAITNVGGTIAVGGRFVESNLVLQFGDLEWEQIGGELEGNIRDLEFYNDQLFVSGGFGIRTFDGTGWIDPLPEAYHDVTDMISFEGNLYFLGNVAGNYFLAAWNPSGMVELTLPDAGVPKHFYRDGDDLYVCGSFQWGSVVSGIAGINDATVQLTGINAPLEVGDMVALNGEFYFINDAGTEIYRGDQFYHTVGQNVSPLSSHGYIRLLTYQDQLICNASGVPAVTTSDGSILSDGFFVLDVAHDEVKLHANDVNALFHPTGVFFQDNLHSRASYEVPSGGGVSTLFASSLWASGTSDDTMYAAAESFFGSAGWPYGPVSDVIDVNYVKRYYRTWNVKRTEIDQHIVHFADPSYQVPVDIANWPGNGIFGNGEAHMLAPFHDADGDNVYVPENGDYPDIRGDEAVFMIFNDQRANHDLSDIEAMNLELHVMAYAYSGNSEPVNSTIFMHCTVFNRSENTYENFSLGVWNDWDIGSNHDDYVACDSIGNLFYGYNGDNIDEQSSTSPGYGEGPPAQGCFFLNQDMAAHIYYNGAWDSEAGVPFLASHYYNYMHGKYKNGNEIPQGAFMFSDSPCEVAFDNEAGQGNVPGDRRSVAATTTSTLNAGDYACFDYAYVYYRDSTQTNFENACSLVDIAPQVKAFYDLQENICELNTLVAEKQIAKNSFSIYPNPGSDVLNIVVNDATGNCCIDVLDVFGKRISSQKIQQTSSSTNLQITVDGWSSGIYLLRLTNGNQRSVLKWVKE